MKQSCSANNILSWVLQTKFTLSGIQLHKDYSMWKCIWTCIQIFSNIPFKGFFLGILWLDSIISACIRTQFC